MTGADGGPRFAHPASYRDRVPDGSRGGLLADREAGLPPRTIAAHAAVPQQRQIGGTVRACW